MPTHTKVISLGWLLLFYAENKNGHVVDREDVEHYLWLYFLAFERVHMCNIVIKSDLNVLNVIFN